MTEKTKKLIGRAFAALTASAVMLSSFSFTAFAEDEETAVTIFTTNDIHGVVSGGAIGLDTVAAIKASTPNSLLVDAGDATQGSSFATVTKGEDVITVMNAAGYDLLVPGNHEFDYGTEQLMANAETADFPFITSNVTLNGDPMFDATYTAQAGDHTIGFVGVTTTHTATATNPSYLAGVGFIDEITAVEEGINTLAAQNVDAIIIVGHLGNETTIPCSSRQLLNGLSASALSKVTAFVDGHSHTVEQEVFEKNGKSVPIIQTGTQLTNLGQLTVTFNEKGEASAEAYVLSAEEAAAYPLNAAGEAAFARVSDLLTDLNTGLEEIMSEVLCENDTPLWGGYVYWDYAEPRIVETNYGDFVTDAFAQYGQIFADNNDLDMPVIAVENGGGISNTLPYGKVTRGDVLNAFNHGNMVVVLKVSPSDMFLALESGLKMTGQDDTGLIVRESVSGSFLQVSGLTYTYDPAAEKNKVVSAVLDDGTSLSRTDTERSLLLVTNSYVGAWFLAEQKLGELGGEDLIVESYILEQTENGTKPLSVPTDGGRIKIAGDKSPDTYTVSVPVLDDEEALANRIVNVRIDDGAAKQYVTDEKGNVNLTLTKGPHTLYLEESTDNVPVYVNNYSGSGTVTTAAGYYRLAFEASAEELPEYQQSAEAPDKGGVSVSTGKNTPISIDDDTAKQLEEEVTADHLTEEEKLAIAGGAVLEVVISAEAADKTVSDKDKQTAEEAAAELDYTVARYFSIDMIKLIDGKQTGSITQLNESIAVTLEIPDDLIAENREFAAVHIHEGKAEILKDLDSAPDTITILTDRFSTYAIVYKDITDANPPTGTAASVTVLVLAGMITAAAALISKKTR